MYTNLDLKKMQLQNGMEPLAYEMQNMLESLH
jgi:hypothetical protein